MKKTLIITTIALAATAGVALTVMAQEPRGHRHLVDCPDINTLVHGCLGYEGMKSMRGKGHGFCGAGHDANELKLIDAQKAQIRDIRRQQREETHEKIRAVLTPEQQALFDAHKQEREAWFGHKNRF
ncbi:MAG: hypothetical protein LBE32_07570 [Burkholderiales bacterium]|nr:hypothetical protein [Burkholderiales bacterium]